MSIIATINVAATASIDNNGDEDTKFLMEQKFQRNALSSECIENWTLPTHCTLEAGGCQVMGIFTTWIKLKVKTSSFPHRYERIQSPRKGSG